MQPVNKFECNKDKARSNFKKHELRFTEGCQIFDGHTLTAESNNNSGLAEKRFVSIGVLNSQIAAVVVWTDRFGHIRVISVRKASRKERERYNAYIKKQVN